MPSPPAVLVDVSLRSVPGALASLPTLEILLRWVPGGESKFCFLPSAFFPFFSARFRSASVANTDLLVTLGSVVYLRGENASDTSTV